MVHAFLEDKIAGAFTNSSSFSGDKLNTLVGLVINTMQHGMIFVGLGMLPSANKPGDMTETSGPKPDAHNRVGSFIGPMSASFQVQPPDAPSKGDLETAEHRLGGMRQQARDDKAAQELILDAAALEHAGAFAVVLEGIPDSVAEAVSSKLHIPTIGIGAGPHCDGQVLVSYDMLGLFDSFVPPFAKQYAKVGEVILNSVNNYADDVRRGIFPKSREDARKRAVELKESTI